MTLKVVAHSNMRDLVRWKRSQPSGTFARPVPENGRKFGSRQLPDVPSAVEGCRKAGMFQYKTKEKDHDVVLFCILLYLLCLSDRAGNVSANARQQRIDLWVRFPAFECFR